MVRKYSTKDILKEGFLGNPPSGSTIDQEENPVKVTILLPKDTLAKMDSMVKNAGVGSRGRLVQFLVDDIWDLQEEYELVADTLVEWASTKQHDSVDLGLALGISGIIRRMERYYPASVTNAELRNSESNTSAQRREGSGTSG
jgi:hypothetical protein